MKLLPIALIFIMSIHSLQGMNSSSLSTLNMVAKKITDLDEGYQEKALNLIERNIESIDADFQLPIIKNLAKSAQNCPIQTQQRIVELLATKVQMLDEPSKELVLSELLDIKEGTQSSEALLSTVIDNHQYYDDFTKKIMFKKVGKTVRTLPSSSQQLFLDSIKKDKELDKFRDNLTLETNPNDLTPLFNFLRRLENQDKQ